MKIRLLGLLALLVWALCDPGWVAAEVTQVALDESGRVNLIDKGLEAKLGLFPEYRGFEEARLFQGADSTFTLEITYRVGDKLQKASQPLSAEQVKALRARVTAAIRLQAPAAALDQRGRSAFLIGTALLSFGYYGWGVPYTFNVDDDRAFGGLYMLTSSAGFFVPFLLTRHRSVTSGEADLSLYGATRGIFHGWCLGALLVGEDRERRDTIVAGMLTSLAEYAAGFWAADRTGMSGGTAATIGAVGDFGLGLGWGAHYVIQRHNEKLEAAAMLAGSGAGVVVGDLLAQSEPYTRGDALVLRGTGDLGTYIGLAASASVSDDDKVAVGSSMAGAVAGLAAGHYLVKGYDFSTGQGVLINLSEVAGGLLGAGLLFITGTDTDPVWPYMLASSAGATGGFWITYLSLGGKARTHGRSSSSSSGTGEPGESGGFFGAEDSAANPSLDIVICPVSAFTSAAPARLAGSGCVRADDARGIWSTPIVGLQYRF